MRRGDESAFAAAFAEHRGAVHRYATQMGGAMGADDVVQETFLTVIRQLDRNDASRGPLRAYLLGIARNLMLKRMAMRPPDTPFEPPDEPIAVQQESPLEQLTRAEAIALVRMAICTLPEPYREVVVLCEMDELEYADAAAVIGCPIGTVRSRLHRAKALLMQKLGPMLRPALAGASSTAPHDRDN